MAVCLSCLGQKKIQGMGFMGEVDCRTCKGTGVAPVTVEIQSVEPVVEQKVATLEIKGESIRHPQLAEDECFLKAETLEIKPTDNWSVSIADKIKRKYTKSAK